MASCNNTGRRTTGINIGNLDTTANPTDDFYQFACGGWMKNNPLTAEYGRYGSFDQLRETNLEQINTLIEELAAGKQDSPLASKIGTMFRVAMDSVKLNADGYAPIAPQLNAIAAVSTREELKDMISQLSRDSYNAYFQFYIAPDERNTSEYILNTYQGGLGLGQRDYYVDKDPHTLEIMAKYREHIEKMFALSGFDAAQAKKAADDVIAIETRIAQKSLSNVELRDPVANYNKMTVSELQTTVPQIDWKSLLATSGLQDVTEINVSQIAPIRESGLIIAGEDIEKQKNYLSWKVIDEAAGFLSDDFVNQNFEFYGKALSGREQLRPRWKRSVDTVNGVMSEALGELYVAKHFPPAAKERMLTLVENLQRSLSQRIDALEWMGDETKAKAQEKLSAFIVKIGYPDKWRDYSALDIQDDSYWGNIARARKFESDYAIAKLGKPVDRSEWHMSPQTVNAYYNPTTNEICFPAAILQPPFFDMNADDAFNYGAIGVVIGHEMTHGFDDQGRQYDKDGNLRDWWTPEDAARFTERAQVLEDQFNSIEVLPGVYANGAFTLGENIADNGGLEVSYNAFKEAMQASPLASVDGFTADQRFFLAYANVWAGNIRDEEIRKLTKNDPHSLGRWRVDGTLPNIDAWYEAFDVKEGDKMYLSPEQRAKIW